MITENDISNGPGKVKNILPDTDKPRIMILGDAPTKDDAFYKKPFATSAGYFLNDALSKVGIRKSECALANVVQEPIRLTPDSWNDPSVQAGITQLKQDIATWKPNVVLCLGNEALHLMSQGGSPVKDYPNKIHKWRGSVFESKLIPGLKCVASYHPAQILRDFSEQAYFRFDLEKLKEESLTEKLELPNREVKILKTREQVADFNLMVTTAGGQILPVAIDIEGSQHNITAISFAWNSEKAYVIPFAHNNGESYWSEEDEIYAWGVVKEIIEHPRQPKIAQNGTYDFYALAWGLGICVQNYAHDTILGWWELYPELKKGLDVQASILTKEPYYKPDKREGDLKFDSDEHFWRYNGIDSAVTFECWNEQMKRMLPQQREHYNFNMELQSGPVLYMMLKGIKWSPERAQERQQQAADEAYRLQFKIDKESGVTWPTDKEALLDDIKQLVIANLCSKRIKKKATVVETKYVVKRWNGKRWVRASGYKQLAEKDLDQLDTTCYFVESSNLVDTNRFTHLLMLCPITKESTKQIDYEPKTVNDCEEFILKSKAPQWRDVKRCVAQIRKGNTGEEIFGALGTALSVSVNVGSTQADGDAQTFLYETCELPCIFENDRKQLSIELPADHKKRIKEGVQSSNGKKIVSSQGALAKLYAKTRDERVLWVLQLRRLRKVVSDLNVTLDDDGRLRSSISLVKETGRMAESKSPGGTGLNRQALNKEHRYICVADPGCELYQFDLEGADNWTVAAECKARADSTMFEDLSIGLKPAQVLALMIHIGPEINDWDRQDIKAKWKELKSKLPDWLYPAAKAGVHGCLTGEHEMLTRDGWVRMDNYDGVSEILVYDNQTRKSWFEAPSHYLKKDYQDTMISLEGNSVSLLATNEHKIPYITNGNAKHMIASLLTEYRSGKIPTSAQISGGRKFLYPDLVAAFQADGSIAKHRITWHFKKARKIERLEKLLTKHNIPFFKRCNNSDGSTRFVASGPIIKSIQAFKHAGSYLLDWNFESLTTFLNEHAYWDGHKKGATSYHLSAVNREHLNWIATVSKLVMRGYTWSSPQTSGYGSIVNRLKINRRCNANINCMSIERLPTKRPITVYCPTVSTGFFAVRRNGKICMTGNSSYGMGWKTMTEGVLKNSMKHLPTRLEDANPLVLTKQQVEDIQAVFFLRYPGVKRWQNSIEQMVRTTGLIEMSSGHRRRFMGRKVEKRGNQTVVNHETWKEALASAPQFYTTYATKKALHKVYYSPENQAKDGRLHVEPILCVHDSLLTQGKQANRAFASKLMHTAFDNPVMIADSKVTIPAEGTVDTDWYMKDEVII